jgi:hypothetical protein
MDKVVRAAQMAERQSMKRSEVWAKHNEQMERMEAVLNDIRSTLERKGRPGSRPRAKK